MTELDRVEKRRREVAQELLGIRSLRRGTINEQYLPVKHRGETDPVLRGPYHVFSRREGGRTVSRRLSTPGALREAREDVERHRRFAALCRELETLTERLGELERAQGVPEGAPKKGLKSRPSRAGR